MFTSLRCQIWDWWMKVIEVSATKQSANLISY